MARLAASSDKNKRVTKLLAAAEDYANLEKVLHATKEHAVSIVNSVFEKIPGIPKVHYIITLWKNSFLHRITEKLYLAPQRSSVKISCPSFENSTSRVLFHAEKKIYFRVCASGASTLKDSRICVGQC